MSLLQAEEIQRQQINRAFVRLGLSTPEVKRRTIDRFGGLGGLGGLGSLKGRAVPLYIPGRRAVVPQAVRDAEDTLASHFRRGAVRPLKLLSHKLGWSEKPEFIAPDTVAEWIAHGVGSALGFTPLAIPAAAAAKIALPAAGVAVGAKAALGGKIAHGATTGALMGAGEAYLEDRDITVGAAFGAAIGGIMPVAAVGAKGAARRIAKSEVLDNSKHLLQRFKFQRRTGVHLAPPIIDDMARFITAMPDDAADAVYGRVAQKLRGQGVKDVGSLIKGQGKNFEALPSRIKLRTLEMLREKIEANNIDMDSAFTPIFRYKERVQMRHGLEFLAADIPEFGTRKGEEMFKKAGELMTLRHRGLLKLGNTGGVKGLAAEFQRIVGADKKREIKNLDQMLLREQIVALDTRSGAILGKMRAMLERNNVLSHHSLDDNSRAVYERMFGYAQAIDDLKIQRLAPLAEEALNRPNANAILAGLVGDEARAVEGVEEKLYQWVSYKDPVTGGTTKFQVRRMLDADGKTIKQVAESAEVLPSTVPFTVGDIAVLTEKPGILSWLQPLRKPLGKAIDRLVARADRASVNSSQQYIAEAMKILKGIGALKGKKTWEIRKAIIHYLETKPEDIAAAKAGIKDFLSAAGYSAKKIDETIVASEKFRTLFNRMGIDFDIPKEMWVDGYFPRLLQDGLRKGHTYEQVFAGVKKRSQQLNDFMVFASGEERTGYLMPHEIDLMKIVGTYARSGAKKKYVQPMLEEVKMLLRDLPEKRKFFNDFVDHRFRNVPTGNENMIDGTLSAVAKYLFGVDTQKRYTKDIVGFITELYYTSGLGYNMFSAMRNLTQQLLAVTDLDPNPLVGIEYWVRAKKFMYSKEGRMLAKLNPLRHSRIPQQDLLDKSMAAGIPVIGDTVDSLSRAGFWAFRKSDLDNIDTSFLMKVLHAKDKGRGLQQAVEEAYSFAMGTQFTYGIQSPAMYSTPLGRMAGVFMSWPLNALSLVYDQLKGQEKIKALTSIAGMVYASEALSLTGVSFRSIHPLETASSLLPFAIMEGDKGMPPGLKLPTTMGQLTFQLAAGDKEAQEKAWNNFKSSLNSVIPFHVAGKRIYNVVEAAHNDWRVYDDKKRLQYEMNKEGRFYEAVGVPKEAMMGLFAPTTAKRQRFEAGGIIRRTDDAYRRLRRQALDAFFDYQETNSQESAEKFLLLQQQLNDSIGKQLEEQDIMREIRLRGHDLLYRQAMRLPALVRDPLLESIRPGQFP